jgi:hypothetical protein
MTVSKDTCVPDALANVANVNVVARCCNGAMRWHQKKNWH